MSTPFRPSTGQPAPTTTVPETSAHRQETDMTEQTTQEQTPPVPTRDRLILEVVRTRAENAVQVSLSQVDENGVGMGYRLAGSKHYNMGVTTLLEEELAERDATNVRAMLDAVFPVKPRVITDPDELDTLPLGTVLRESGDRQRLWELVEVRIIGFCRDPWWLTPGEANAHQSPEIVLPATVLHIPTEEGQADA